MSKHLERYNHWLQCATDSTVVAQLNAMKGNDEAISNAFFQNLQFGTAGLRGIMGAGSACINYYTILRATEGLARYMDSQHYTSCAVTFDSRHNGAYYAEVVACVMASHNIVCHITQQCQPTPYLSFMVRQLHCDIGVNITASHNPGEYNGYKVYDGTGCQLLDEVADTVTSYIEGVDCFDVPLLPFAHYVDSGLVHYTSQELLQQYTQQCLLVSNNSCSGLDVTFTPLCGAGHQIVPSVLASIGVSNIHIVAEQSQPNGDFPTCSYPNPEKAEAMALAIATAESNGSDIVIGTDPDCDRIGVAVRHNGSFVQLSGNDVGILMCDYVLAMRAEQGTLPANGIIVRTIVSSILVDRICQQYGVEVQEVLTGFKYIGNVINKLEAVGQMDRYIVGYEESCGYLIGTAVRDKDGVVASILVAELTAHYKRCGMTLVDRMNQLAEQYGTYQYLTVSYKFAGAEGATVKQALLDQIRTNGISTLAGLPTTATDYLTTQIGDLPRADVMSFVTSNGTKLIVRPSGTEPLIKCYITVSGSIQHNQATIASIQSQLDQLMGQ